ncbi:hypothetical protein M8494_33040 [Serratia ureilytica]
MVEVSVTPHHKNRWLASASEINGRTWLGLFGVFLAVMASGVENASKFALADIQGGMLLSFDAGSWLTTCYVTGFVIGSGSRPVLADLFAAPGGVDDVRHLPGRWTADALVGRTVWRAAGGAQPAGLRRRCVATDADDGGAAFAPPLIKVLGLGAYGWVSPGAPRWAPPPPPLPFTGAGADISGTCR